MKPTSGFTRFSIRFLLTAVLGVAVAFGVLQIPDARSTRLMDHVHSGRADVAFAMFTREGDAVDFAYLKESLRNEDVRVSTSPPSIAQYLHCERTVYIVGDMGTFEFTMGLSSCRCSRITERLVSRGEIER